MFWGIGFFVGGGGRRWLTARVFGLDRLGVLVFFVIFWSGRRVEDVDEEVVIVEFWTTTRGRKWHRVLLDMELVGLLDTKALTFAWLEIVFLIPRNLFGMSRTHLV